MNNSVTALVGKKESAVGPARALVFKQMKLVFKQIKLVLNRKPYWRDSDKLMFTSGVMINVYGGFMPGMQCERGFNQNIRGLTTVASAPGYTVSNLAHETEMRHRII